MTYFHRANFRRFSVSSPNPAAAPRASRIVVKVETDLTLQDEPAGHDERENKKPAD